MKNLFLVIILSYVLCFNGIICKAESVISSNVAIAEAAINFICNKYLGIYSKHSPDMVCVVNSTPNELTVDIQARFKGQERIIIGGDIATHEEVNSECYLTEKRTNRCALSVSMSSIDSSSATEATINVGYLVGSLGSEHGKLNLEFVNNKWSVKRFVRESGA